MILYTGWLVVAAAGALAALKLGAIVGHAIANLAR